MRQDRTVCRRVKQFCLGPIVYGIAPPIPDVDDGPTLIAGCESRFCHSNPPPQDLDGLKSFVEGWVRDNLNPLVEGDLPTMHEYVMSTNHPLWRRLELDDAAKDVERSSISREDFVNKSHGKRETYPKYKHARGINSRTDRFKVYSGRYFHAIENVLYSRPEFIKHVPVCDRARFVVERLGCHPGPYYETDYSHFESHFTPEVMRSLELVLYKHMLSNFPGVYRVIESALIGVNVCRFHNFTLKIRGVRMSGDMCTSLGNGFSNLMLAKYVAFKKSGVLDGIVEGDDGLFVSSVPLTAEDFASLGFEIKMLSHNDLYETQFCGLQFSRSLCNLTDPVDVLVNFPWSHSSQVGPSYRVRLELLRAKALSLRYEYPRCPILTALGQRYIQLTSGSRARFDGNWYERNVEIETIKYRARTDEEVSLGIDDITRADFSRLFGISTQLQLAIEDEISRSSLMELGGPVLKAFLRDVVHPDVFHYWDNFVCAYGVRRQPDVVGPKRLSC